MSDPILNWLRFLETLKLKQSLPNIRPLHLRKKLKPTRHFEEANLLLFGRTVNAFTNSSRKFLTFSEYLYRSGYTVNTFQDRIQHY